ncbi:Eco47II family restriction endonuclease [Mycoplasmopsis felis]|uniref:Eco47II family restriction endonuclease n=1 Tax=Mycoplasmopsis felis TaxID=33923 RepID=UPI002AFF7ED0|nr:Eco47II family restriction endonuclease [Mycoplasmopsis felis]WQQ06992.1 Eco47II family restriction endonuclease [Mycoplasmopsis felis]
MTKYNLTFINEVDFENHILETILQYQKSIQSFDLNKFLKNKIDPIKLLFDSVIYNNNLEETIKQEINRQKDKTNNNIIGYFHQNIFKYIKNCYVPEKGWDVIFTHPKTKIKYYIEIKNKHNTMNSSNAKFIHNKMQIHNKENPNDVFILVEVISMHSFNKEWIINNSKPNPNIRIMSIDYFYEIVTDIHDAFIQLINQLQISLKNVLNKFPQIKQNSKDTVLEELKTIDEDILKTLYKITFESYNGFDYMTLNIPIKNNKN